MDKNAIKKYAVWARRELISRVSQKAYQYGIRENDIADANADSIDGKLLTDSEKKERQALIAQVKEKGFEQVMEEVAYTWFNRFSALRFMEVNGYLPTHVRVFTDNENNFKPQIITEAIHLELDGLDMDKVYAYVEADDKDELYKYLLITQCNALNKILPGMFQKIVDYTELLFPDNLLREGSVIEQMIALIPENDWLEAVEIIGWLYQYYINEPKDFLINAKKQYKSKDVPFVTQIFTSDWIVKYMVQNSLGRSWIDSSDKEAKQYGWEYYLESQVREHTDSISNPEEICVIDPCMGSGHILVYAFDVLMQIYEDYGYNQREAAELILYKNLYGLDISERAYQLAYFSVMMQARKYCRNILKKGIEPNLYVLSERRPFYKEIIDFIADGNTTIADTLVRIDVQLKDLAEAGSLVHTDNLPYDEVLDRLTVIDSEYYDNIINRGYQMSCREEVVQKIKIAKILSMQYDAVITNPPYIGNRLLPSQLKNYIEENYGQYKSDIFSAFVVRILDFCKYSGYIGMLTPYVWMFISAYKDLRQKVLYESTITSLVQLEYNAFEAACVPVCSFSLRKGHITEYGEYVRLSNFRGADIQGIKVIEAVRNRTCGYRYSTNQDKYELIPGSPIAYWVSESFAKNYLEKSIGDYAEVITGMTIGDNNKYLRLWFEVEKCKISIGSSDMSQVNIEETKWIPYSKGGTRRNWYGNYEYVVDWSQKDNFNRSKTTLQRLYLREAITWPFITSGDFSARLLPCGFLWDVAGSPCFFANQEQEYYTLGAMCSKVVNYILNAVNPTINVQAVDIANVPLLFKDDDTTKKVVDLVKSNLTLSKEDWDAVETSWDFAKHPLIRSGSVIKEIYAEWENECAQRYNSLKQNEEEINRIFIDIYGLQDELTSEVDDAAVTVQKANLEHDIKSMISYAVGCMFGRYSLDVDGLAYAGGDWDASKYHSYPADEDNIIPICDDEYFLDDIFGRFVKFIEIVYGKEMLEENLKFVADALPYTGTTREVLRQYFINDFFVDHCDMYTSRGAGKRPIYWLFDSGKKNGFKALIYMHRYQPDTIARMRTDYVHEQQERYRTAIAHLEQRTNDAPTSERVKLNKQLGKLQDQATEVRVYEEKIHHLADQMIRIDLDDGVKQNYDIFKDVLANIK